MSVVDQYTQPTRTVLIASQEHADKVEAVRVAIRKAKVGFDTGSLADPLPQLELDLAAAEATADEDAIKFVFRALSAGELETLRLAHPSTDKDSNFNVETFPAALLAAACTQAGDDDGLTVDEAEAVWATFSEGDCVALYNAAWGVATTANLRPFSVADTGNADQNSVPNSTTAPPEALHIATS